MKKVSMDFASIVDCLEGALGSEVFIKVHAEATQPYVFVAQERLLEVSNVLFSHSSLYFDYLACITCLDLGVERNLFEVDYRFYSIPFAHHFVLKVQLPRVPSVENDPNFICIESQWLPKIPSLVGLWKTADWHEREGFDMMGIYFEGHPDLRRILLPADWVGFPLRKDYVQPEWYQGIKVAL